VKGINFLGNRRLEITDLPDPEVKEGDVLVRVKASAICGSEMETYIPPEGLSWFGNPGHEVMGVIEDPNGSKRFKKGDRVGLGTPQGCGECYWCRQSKPIFCKKAYVPMNGHSEFIVGKEIWMQSVPDDIEDTVAVLVAADGLGVPYGSTMRAGVKAGDKTCIFGTGPVGQSMTLIQSFLGARVIAIDVNPKALEFATAMGAWKTINPNESDDIRSEILELTDGLGPNVSFDACGNQEMFNVALDTTIPDGTVMTVGHGNHGIDSVRERLSFHVDHEKSEFWGRNLRVMGNWGTYFSDFTDQINMIRNGLQVRRMIASTYPFEKAAEAYENYFTKGIRGKTILIH